jgi:signal transduction histidine kinase
MNSPGHFTNQQLLDELNKRLVQDDELRTLEEFSKMEIEIRTLSLRLRESESGKSRFLSNIRNEINNPLTSIIGLASSIHSVIAEEKVKNMSSLIYKQALALDFQMRNIIIAAEIEMGEINPKPSRVNIISLVEDQVSYLKEKIDHHGAIVKLYLPSELRFYTDAYSIQIICMNLFANAIEFCESNKIVIIEAKEFNGELRLLVRDFGNGIDPEYRKKIFDRFMQGESGVTKAHGGHGLGLTIVNELVNLLGGTISLESLVGEGTTFTVTVPELTPTNGEKSFSNSGNEILFIADDEF